MKTTGGDNSIVNN